MRILSFLLIMLALLFAAAGLLLVDDTPCTPDFCVMTWNMGDSLMTATPDVATAVHVVREAGSPDILLLQEIPGESWAERFAVRSGLPHHEIRPTGRTKVYVGVFSRYPILWKEALYFEHSKQGKLALACRIRMEESELLAVSVHLDTFVRQRMKDGDVNIWSLALMQSFIREIFAPNTRSLSVGELLDWLDGIDAGPVVVGGDFNTVFASTAIRRMYAELDDALWPDPTFFGHTYTRVDFLVKPRIDFLFHS